MSWTVYQGPPVQTQLMAAACITMAIGALTVFLFAHYGRRRPDRDPTERRQPPQPRGPTDAQPGQQPPQSPGPTVAQPDQQPPQLRGPTTVQPHQQPPDRSMPADRQPAQQAGTSGEQPASSSHTPSRPPEPQTTEEERRRLAADNLMDLEERIKCMITVMGLTYPDDYHNEKKLVCGVMASLNVVCPRCLVVDFSSVGSNGQQIHLNCKRCSTVILRYQCLHRTRGLS